MKLSFTAIFFFSKSLFHNRTYTLLLLKKWHKFKLTSLNFYFLYFQNCPGKSTSLATYFAWELALVKCTQALPPRIRHQEPSAIQGLVKQLEVGLMLELAQTAKRASGMGNAGCFGVLHPRGLL